MKTTVSKNKLCKTKVATQPLVEGIHPPSDKLSFTPIYYVPPFKWGHYEDEKRPTPKDEPFVK